ncbi:carbohydrate ABC transporter permease [Armatimonas sp.]|uniref:carbohydrate ABC transporter permease n=1 Tax=Armatimonas sp. TaxID=1872638 RepID=UPI003751A624
MARKVAWRSVAAWLFTLPALTVQCVFGWLPVVFAFVIAFQRYYFVKEPEFVGVRNFQDVLGDPLVGTAFLNTFIYASLALGLTFFVPIFVSILLMEMSPRVIRVMMILWFLPIAATAGIAIWKYLYHPRLGLLNGFLGLLGIAPQKWLDDPNLAMLSLVLPGIVLFGPGLIYIAALQNVPEELYEAAELEGAGILTKIRFVTLPRLRPIIAMMLIFSVIGSLQVFEGPFLMTGGGPGYATTTVVMYLYNLAFGAYNLGKSTALAIVLFFVILALTSVQRRFFKENVDE